MLNDLVAPLLSKLRLRPLDASYFALNVSDIRFVGTLRLRLSPAARFGFVGFTSPPRVALGISVAYHSKLGFERRMPVTALPGARL